MNCKCDSPCTCGKCKPNPDCNMSCLKRFDVALNTRNFEIDLFWRRSNYFLVLNTAIAVGFVSLVKEGGDVEKYISLLLCAIGFVVCLTWFKVNLGSKYWQSHWEQILEETASEMGVFYFTQNTEERVKENIKIKKDDPCWKECYKELTLTKPSVSICMTFLSLFFLGIWILVGSVISCYLGYVASCNLGIFIPYNKCVACLFPIVWIGGILLIVHLAIPELFGYLHQQKKNNREVK